MLAYYNVRVRAAMSMALGFPLCKWSNNVLIERLLLPAPPNVLGYLLNLQENTKFALYVRFIYMLFTIMLELEPPMSMSLGFPLCKWPNNVLIERLFLPVPSNVFGYLLNLQQNTKFTLEVTVMLAGGASQCEFIYLKTLNSRSIYLNFDYYFMREFMMHVSG